LKFSYYFNPERTERIDFNFELSSIDDTQDTQTIANYTIGIEEYTDNKIANHISKGGTFHFSIVGVPNEEFEHDINFGRIRYDNKWIFEAVNNKNNSEQDRIGLICSKENNPLGLDITNTSELYDAQLKANTFSQLEQDYEPPEDLFSEK
jgi:hypothetical protein